MLVLSGVWEVCSITCFQRVDFAVLFRPHSNAKRWILIFVSVRKTTEITCSSISSSFFIRTASTFILPFVELEVWSGEQRRERSPKDNIHSTRDGEQQTHVRWHRFPVAFVLRVLKILHRDDVLKFHLEMVAAEELGEEILIDKQQVEMNYLMCAKQLCCLCLQSWSLQVVRLWILIENAMVIERHYENWESRTKVIQQYKGTRSNSRICCWTCCCAAHGCVLVEIVFSNYPKPAQKQ